LGRELSGRLIQPLGPAQKRRVERQVGAKVDRHGWEWQPHLGQHVGLWRVAVEDADGIVDREEVGDGVD
jgi:hypothetical protein